MEPIMDIKENFHELNKIRNVIAVSNDCVSVGFEKSFCIRVNLKHKMIEGFKVLEDPFVKMKWFDHNTNIVLTDKSILFDDKRMKYYVSYINNFFIKYEEKKYKYRRPRCFLDFDLTGISLCAMTSLDTLHYFDLRYNYATNCMYLENAYRNMNPNFIKKHLNKLWKMKYMYNFADYIKYAKYNRLQDNIILTPILKKKRSPLKSKRKYVDFIKNRIIADESFVYTVLKEDSTSDSISSEIPGSMMHLWRWGETKPCKNIFTYGGYLQSYNVYANSMYEYENFIFDSIYKLYDAPNHLFVTYDNLNYIHSLIPPTFNMRVKDTLDAVPECFYPINL